MTTPTKKRFPPSREQAFQARQLDTGWGYAFAHYLPFVAIYYGLTRRTLTPMAVYIAGCALAGFVYGIANPNTSEKQMDTASSWIALGSMPVLIKLGQEKARKHAAKKLGIEEGK